MLFNNITASTLAALALLFSPALSLPEGQKKTSSVSPARALDLTVKYYGYNNCADGGGPNRDYSAGTCLELPESSHGVKITSRRGGCYLVRYTGRDCTGTSQKLDDTLCHDIGDRWNSLKFEC